MVCLMKKYIDNIYGNHNKEDFLEFWFCYDLNFEVKHREREREKRMLYFLLMKYIITIYDKS